LGIWLLFNITGVRKKERNYINVHSIAVGRESEAGAQSGKREHESPISKRLCEQSIPGAYFI
jgi:hypothetical protein